MSIAIAVHGGAGTIDKSLHEAFQAGCKEATFIGWKILQEGGAALDAVEAAVRSLEDNPVFNAGTGSSLNAEGNIQMDAGVMEGHTLRVGSVAGIELIKNPISLARRILESPHVLLIGEGARDFALEQGFTLCTRVDLLTERQRKLWLALRDPSSEEQEVLSAETGRDLPDKRLSHAQPPLVMKPNEGKHGTVGAVARDGFGTLAAATSTGGMPNKHPGRVGDTPLIGCGFYADEFAAISCTGYGEDFMRLLMAKRAADFVVQGANAQRAAEEAVKVLSARASGTGGLIIVDKDGNVGFARNSEHIARGFMQQGMTEPIVGI